MPSSLHFPLVVAQPLDLVAEAVAAIGDDPFDVAEPDLEPGVVDAGEDAAERHCRGCGDSPADVRQYLMPIHQARSSISNCDVARGVPRRLSICCARSP